MVSFREPDQSWGKPYNLGADVNSAAGDWRPTLSPDGKHLFFSSFRAYEAEAYSGKSYAEITAMYEKPLNGSGTIFWISADLIQEFKGN